MSSTTKKSTTPDTTHTVSKDRFLGLALLQRAESRLKSRGDLTHIAHCLMHLPRRLRGVEAYSGDLRTRADAWRAVRHYRWHTQGMIEARLLDLHRQIRISKDLGGQRP